MSNKRELLQQQYTLLLKGRKTLDEQLETYKSRFDTMCREIHKVEGEIAIYEKNLLFLEGRIRKDSKSKPIDIPAPKVIPFEEALPLPILITKDIKDDEEGVSPCVFESVYIPECSESAESAESAETVKKVIDFDDIKAFKPELDKVGAVGWFVKVWTDEEFEGGIIKLQKKQLKLKTNDGIMNIPYYMIQDWERIDL